MAMFRILISRGLVKGAIAEAEKELVNGKDLV
jgi:hypothetical protein